MGGPKLILIML